MAIIIVPKCPDNYQAVSVDNVAQCKSAPSAQNAPCVCVPGDSPISIPLVITAGNPISVDSGAKIQRANDYSTADGLLSVARNYSSKSRDLGRAAYPLEIPGFGEHWHGLIPGRLTAYGYNMGTVEYLSPSGDVKRFSGGQDETEWQFDADDVTRLKLSMVTTPTTDRPTFFGASLPSTPSTDGEMRLSFANGDYILFRRAGDFIADTGTNNFSSDSSTGRRYLVPIEAGSASGYRIFFDYPDNGQFPNKIRDSLNRELNLTWANLGWAANELSGYYKGPDVSPDPQGMTLQKAISAIALPDGTRLSYTYAVNDSSGFLGALQSVRHLDAAGNTLWSRTYLYEDSRFPNALTGMLDQNGNRLSTYSYDEQGRGASTELAGGVNRQQVTYDGETGRQVTNPLGLRTNYTYDARMNSGEVGPATVNVPKRLQSVEDEATDNTPQITTNYEYTGPGLPSGKTDANGNYSTQENDAATRRPTSITDASGTVTTLEWHPTLDLVTQVVRPGLTTDYTYSSTGLLLTKTLTDTTTQTVPYSTAGQVRTWTYAWNGNGRLLSIDGPKGPDTNGKDDITSFTYDASGNLLTSTNALGHVTHFANYDANGRPGKMTDPNGIDTLYAYDQLGRVTSVTVKNPVSSSGDAITTFDYDVEGRVIGITSPGTQKMFIDRNLAGQVTAFRATSGEEIALTNDAMGNVTIASTKRADGTTAREITRTFDGLGRLLTETLGTNRTRGLSYDSLGNVVSITSARSYATTQAFVSLNRLISSVAPDNGTSGATYDAFDRATSFTDPATVQTTFVRDGFGDVIQEVSPDRGTSTYYYDAAGYMTASIDGRGQRVDIVRDAFGRILSKTPAGRPASEVVSYSYDLGLISGSYNIGRLSSAIDGTGETQFSYDHRGNLLIKRRKNGATLLADLAYTYDLADRIQNIVYPSGRIVHYLRDAFGRVVTVTTKPVAGGVSVILVSNITYEPFGSILGATYGNGLKLAQSWGNDGRLASRRLYRTVSGANLSSLVYGYDNDDNIVSIADNVDPTRSVTYGYDAVGRLTQSVLASGSARRQDLIYDTNGNVQRTELRTNPTDATPASTSTYTLNPGTNQLASVADVGGTRAITYDGRGNTIGETRPGAGITVGYDGLGRLTSYQTSGGDSLINEYNALDDRITGGTAADPQHYVYDMDGRMMGEYGVSYADVKAETIWLSPEVNTPVQPIGGDDGVGGYAPLAVVTGGGSLYWVHGNHLGVPIVITDSAGNLAAPTGYTPVGFPGQTRTLADLYYNRYRDYDPTTGRYIQADPIGLQGDDNPYAYAGNNPINSVDPAGLETLWEHYTGLPDQYRVNAINAIAGWQDALTLGYANDFRDWVGLNRDVDRCTTAYGVGEMAGVGTGILIGGVGGWEAAGTRGTGKEFSHWIPNRMGGPRSLWNGNYVPIEVHALSDPFRYRFMRRVWKAVNPMPNVASQQWTRIPNVYKGAAVGGATGAAGSALSNNCTCPQ